MPTTAAARLLTTPSASNRMLCGMGAPAALQRSSSGKSTGLQSSVGLLFVLVGDLLLGALPFRAALQESQATRFNTGACAPRRFFH